MNFASRPPRDYEAYGLSVRSPLSLPFLPLPVHRAGEPDVTVRIGATPSTLSSAIIKQRHRQISPNAFLLNVKDGARYMVTNGRDILVEPRGGSDLAYVLTGSVFAALLQQRGLMTLHASAIETEAGAALFMGPSGAGKSSILASFVRRGYAMLADDVTGIVLDADGRVVALPAFPSMKLQADMVRRMAWQRRARPTGHGKYIVPVERFRAAPVAIRAAFALDIHDRDDVELRPVQAADSFRHLWKSIYRKRCAHGLGRLQEFFPTTVAMARHLSVVHTARPPYPFRLDALVDRIEEYLR